jgi:hypothetical protein
MGLFSCGNTKNYLKDFGYGTIALPREGIKPLLMLAKRGDRLSPLGPVASTFLPGASPLPTAARSAAAAISGSKSKSVDAKIGISLLGKVIGALAGSSLGLDVAYKNAKKVQFEFGDVTQEAIDITALDQYLSNGSVAPGTGNFIKQALEDDDVYVIVATLDARQISVAASGENSASVSVDVPVIQQIVGAKVAVSSGGSSSSKVTYTSTTTPLSFGLKVVRLVFKNGKYTTLKPEGGVGSEAVEASSAGFGPDVPTEI